MIRLHKAERWFLRVGVFTLICFFAVIVIDVATSASHGVPGGMRMVDPAEVTNTPPFDKPGIKHIKGNQYEAVIVAYTFGFLPQKMSVPEGANVRFVVTSMDVVHGFTIPGKTNVNFMVLPGHVTEASQVFHKAGRYLVLCNEYCGTGHQYMTTHILVTRKGSK